jgi:hypothetical protein
MFNEAGTKGTSARGVNEWWIEIEIIPRDRNWKQNDEILLALHKEILSSERQNIKSWHFFREPTLRFRIELTDKENRDRVAKKLRNLLDSIELVEQHFFANHGQRVENLDEGYKGERETYKRMWPYQKKLWEWGSEMAVEAIKEHRETGTNDPSREFQLERLFHLLFNQLNPLVLNEVELYQRCATNRILPGARYKYLSINSLKDMFLSDMT